MPTGTPGLPESQWLTLGQQGSLKNQTIVFAQFADFAWIPSPLTRRLR